MVKTKLSLYVAKIECTKDKNHSNSNISSWISANFRHPMDKCYHNPCDNVSTMLTADKVAFLAKTTQAIVFTVAKEIVVVGSGKKI